MKLLPNIFFLFVLFNSILLNSVAFSKENNTSEQIVEEENYAKEHIGSYYRFIEKVEYFYLSNSSSDIVFKENGALFMLTRTSMAKLLTKTQTFPVAENETFKLVKVFKTVFNDLDNWDQAQKNLYLNMKKRIPELDMYFLFEDSNGTKFITMSGTFKRAELISK